MYLIYFLPCDASICSHNENGCHVTFQGAIQKRETLNIQHVNFINKENLETTLRENDLGIILFVPQPL